MAEDGSRSSLDILGKRRTNGFRSSIDKISGLRESYGYLTFEHPRPAETSVVKGELEICEGYLKPSKMDALELGRSRSKIPVSGGGEGWRERRRR